MTVQQEPRQAHNGISTSFTAWDNNVSWCLNLTSSGFGLNTIIAALPAEELCMIEGSTCKLSTTNHADFALNAVKAVWVLLVWSA